MPVDYTGHKWYQLKALRFTHFKLYPRRTRGPDSVNKVPYWDFECDCGKITNASIASVRRGDQKSCGCRRLEMIKNLTLRHGDATSKSKHNRIYRIWAQMKRRCQLKSVKSYFRYGGRGIEVCTEWSDDYVTFKQWSLNNGYDDRLTLDRIDNDGNYTPDNCRWVDRTTQANNRRSNKIVEYKGKTYTIAELSKETNTCQGRLSHRIAIGYTTEEAVEMPLTRRSKGFSKILSERRKKRELDKK